jgi:hypothetical protein
VLALIDQLRQLIKDLTPLITALAPIIVGYWTYHSAKKPSGKERDDQEIEKLREELKKEREKNAK